MHQIDMFSLMIDSCLGTKCLFMQQNPAVVKFLVKRSISEKEPKDTGLIGKAFANLRSAGPRDAHQKCVTRLTEKGPFGL